MDGQRFMYVKQELLENLRQNQGKVLINPLFVNRKFVTPHFNRQFLQNQHIHINPNVLRTSQKAFDNVKELREDKIEASKQPLLISPTKLVVSPAKQTVIPPPIRQTAMQSKYKIVRSTPLKTSLTKSKNKFSIDRRSPTAKLKKFSFNKNKVKSKNVYTKNNLNSSKSINVNRIVCKTNFRPNIKKCKTRPTVGGGLKVQLLTIRGQKYKLDSGHHTLTLINNQAEKPKSLFKTIYVGGMSFKQKEPNIFVKANTHKRLLSLAKQRSINTLTNKLRKSNIPCPLYHKFGKCRGKDSGKCIRLHNPDQISLCPRFLQGACTNNKCLLSHKVSAEKMPTCKFFLEGLCAKDDCPYLHVKINSKAEICKDFLEGFCRKAAECEKRHEYLCPNYERFGKCSKSGCHYPHGSVVRKCKISKLMLRNLQGKDKHKIVNKKNIRRSEQASIPDKGNSKSEEFEMNVRYYVDVKIDNDNVSDEGNKIKLKNKTVVAERPKLGTLPSFIPFSDKSKSVAEI